MFCKSRFILGHQKRTEAHEVPYEMMILSVTDIRDMVFYISATATGNGGVEGVMAKAHGNAGVKRENQQQLDVMKWEEKGSEVGMVGGTR